MDQEERRTLEAYYESLPPEERRSRVILKAEFRDSYNELVQAHRQFPVPEYLWRKWLPVIGPLPVLLYLQLRRYCYYNPSTGEKRDICWPKQSRLAAEVGVKDRKTLRKALVVLEGHGFIERESVYFKDPGSGRPHQGADKYRVFFELPLRPEDAAELLARRMASGDGQEVVRYGGNFSPHRRRDNVETSYEGKSSSHGGGEKTDSNVITRNITKNVLNVMNGGRECPERATAEALALEIGETLNRLAGQRNAGRHQSEGFHRLVASRMPEALVRKALMVTRDAVELARSGSQKGCRTTPAQLFTGVVKNLAAEKQIDLGLNVREGTKSRMPIPATDRSVAQRCANVETSEQGATRMSAEESRAILRQLVETLANKHPART